MMFFRLFPHKVNKKFSKQDYSGSYSCLVESFPFTMQILHVNSYCLDGTSSMTVLQCHGLPFVVLWMSLYKLQMLHCTV